MFSAIKRLIRSAGKRALSAEKAGGKQFLGLICRCRDEYFIAEFCEHYLNEGVDQIIVIDDDSADKSIYDGLEAHGEAVRILYSHDIIRRKVANQTFQEVRDGFEWLIYLDVDEFVTAPAGNDKTIREALQTTFAHADCVKVPWVMMACNGLEKAPESLLRENTYRWNHDLKHPHEVHKFRCRYDEIEVKCIFRPDVFQIITEHHPDEPTIKNPVVVESIRGEQQPLDPFFPKLREGDIRTGHLLCYHYRISSIENSRNKLTNNSFYKARGYTLDDLMASDHAEVIDTTLQQKSARRIAGA